MSSPSQNLVSSGPDNDKKLAWISVSLSAVTYCSFLCLSSSQELHSAWAKTNASVGGLVGPCSLYQNDPTIILGITVIGL